MTEEPGEASPSEILLRPGENCWRIEHASKAALIVDADDYYRHARQAMRKAQRQILLIGWDFDTRIELDREEKDEGPRRLGKFMLWLARRRPELQIHVLKWDMGAIKLFGRGSTFFHLAKWMRQPGISFRLDGAHPTGASHHQKILVIDDSFAFCGGIDMTGSRWDTRAHDDNEPGRRTPFLKRPYGPWHDATMAVEGDVARALGDHARDRWKAACGEDIHPPMASESAWPDDLVPDFEELDIGISRTRGATDEQTGIREVERLFLDMLASAKRLIYVETQYFASRLIAEAIVKRLSEPDCPEIVIVNPATADGWLEERVMGPARAELWNKIKQCDSNNHFKIYTPVTQAGADIYVHAKIMIMDDLVLRVGSANMNNRSMGLDSECDLTIDARIGECEVLRRKIASIRNDLLAEHLGCEAEQVADARDESGSLIAAIDVLCGNGRSLKAFRPPDFSDAEKTLAKSELLDPESADTQFEPAAHPGLLVRLQNAAFRRA